MVPEAVGADMSRAEMSSQLTIRFLAQCGSTPIGSNMIFHLVRTRDSALSTQHSTQHSELKTQDYQKPIMAPTMLLQNEPWSADFLQLESTVQRGRILCFEE